MEPRKRITDNRNNNFYREIFLYTFILKPYIYIIAFITSIAPFSLLFTNKIYHARWFGADRIINLVGFASIVHRNQFIESIYDRDEHSFFVFGKFKKEPKRELFNSIQELAKERGLEIRYCGEFENGKYKFMAPINQNWHKWVWY